MVPEARTVQEPEAGEHQEHGAGILGRTVGAILGVGPGRDADQEETTDEPVPERSELDEVELGVNQAPAAQMGEEAPGDEDEDGDLPAGDRINLNGATFEDLRELGFSVTQATRVITYRDRQKGFDSVDDLGEVPGMPREFLSSLKGKLTL